MLTAGTESDLDTAFTAMARQGVDALIVKPDQFFVYRRERFVALAAHHAMPTIYPIRAFVEVGGLMGYGTNWIDLFRQAGAYTGKFSKA